MRSQFTEHKSGPLSVLLHSAFGRCNPNWQGTHSVSKDLVSILPAGCHFHPLKAKLKDTWLKIKTVFQPILGKKNCCWLQRAYLVFFFYDSTIKKRLCQSRNKTRAVQKANKEANLLCSLSSHLCTETRWRVCYRTIWKWGRKSSCLRSGPLPEPQCTHLQQLIQCSLNSSHLV